MSNEYLRLQTIGMLAKECKITLEEAEERLEKMFSEANEGGEIVEHEGAYQVS